MKIILKSKQITSGVRKSLISYTDSSFRKLANRFAKANKKTAVEPLVELEAEFAEKTMLFTLNLQFKLGGQLFRFEIVDSDFRKAIDMGVEVVTAQLLRQNFNANFEFLTKNT